MKQLTSYARAAGYLNKILDLLNDRYFESALSRPVLTIQSTPKAYGHYTLFDAWSVDGEKGMREINIGAGTLSRPIENVVATLLHEMVHYWNDQQGVKDTSRGGTYHNKNFKEAAESRDLQVTHHEKYGWAITAPTDTLVEFCVDNNLNEIRLNRNDGVSVRVTGTGTHSGTSGATPVGSGVKKPSSLSLLWDKCQSHENRQYRMFGLPPANGASGINKCSYSITNANTEKQVNWGVL